jgi:hypothetical protein
MRHRFGVYVRVKTNKTIEERRVKRRFCTACEKEHCQHGVQNFCTACGEKLPPQEYGINYTFPRLYDILGDNERLADITPPELSSWPNVEMVLVGNLPDDKTVWLRVGNIVEENECQIKEFPTENDIKKMIKNFYYYYNDDLEKLRQSPHVASMKVEVGYVADVEY